MCFCCSCSICVVPESEQETDVKVVLYVILATYMNAVLKKDYVLTPIIYLYAYIYIE